MASIGLTSAGLDPDFSSFALAAFCFFEDFLTTLFSAFLIILDSFFSFFFFIWHRQVSSER
jgi:hypothetical protein